MNREKIKSIIRFKQEQPTKTLQQIGNYFGVSKPYIYKVLKQDSKEKRSSHIERPVYMII